MWQNASLKLLVYKSLFFFFTFANEISSPYGYDEKPGTVIYSK